MPPTSAPSPCGAWQTPARRWGKNVQWGMKGWSGQTRRDDLPITTMSTMASQITGILIVYSTICSDAEQRKHRSSASLAFVRTIHWWPVNSPHKGPEMRKMVPFVIWWRHHVLPHLSGASELTCWTSDAILPTGSLTAFTCTQHKFYLIRLRGKYM